MYLNFDHNLDGEVIERFAKSHGLSYSNVRARIVNERRKRMVQMGKIKKELGLD